MISGNGGPDADGEAITFQSQLFQLLSQHGRKLLRRKNENSNFYISLTPGQASSAVGEHVI